MVNATAIERRARSESTTRSRLLGGAAGLAFTIACSLSLSACSGSRGSDRPLESLWYVVDSEESIEAFLTNAGEITIVAPVAFGVDERGNVFGAVDPRVMRTARARGVRVMPVVHQPRFEQAAFERVLQDPQARRRVVADLARICQANGFWGLQFDFEHIHVRDRDRYTALYTEAADALRSVGCSAGVAVVPRTGDEPVPTPYDRWMHMYWRGAYDHRALAAAGDFIILMAYDQHTRNTSPGPVAGFPWVQQVLDYTLAEGVAPEKILLGIPAYSRLWYPAPSEIPTPVDTSKGVGARGLTHADATALVARRGVEPVWDAATRSYSATWNDGPSREFLSLQNARTFEARLDLARARRLRGFAVWRAGHEDTKVWEVLRRSPITLEE